MFMMISSIQILSLMFILLSGLWVYWKKGKSFKKNREKSSPFECGFDPNIKSRLPFSLRFFLLLVFFLIFDIEMILLLQLPVILSDFYFKVSLFMLKFLWVLFLGFLEEWRRGALNWKK